MALKIRLKKHIPLFSLVLAVRNWLAYPRTLISNIPKIKKGKLIFDKIALNYNDNSVYFFSHDHFGELIAGLYYIGCIQDSHKVVICSNNFKVIQCLYTHSDLKFHIVDDCDEIEALRVYTFYSHKANCFSLFSVSNKYPFTWHRNNFYESYRAFFSKYELGSAPLKPVFPPVEMLSSPVKELYSSTEKLVVLNPFRHDTNDSSRIKLFDELAYRLNLDGWKCICAIGKPNQQGLNNCQNLFLTFAELGAILKQKGVIIAVRSGFCDVLMFTGAPMICLYHPDDPFHYPIYHLDRGEPNKINNNIIDSEIDVNDIRSSASKIVSELYFNPKLKR